MKFDIKMQCDKTLVYSDHSCSRSDERNVPLPKYVPINAILMGICFRESIPVYEIQFEFRGRKYILVVDKSMLVRTVYQQSNKNVMNFVNKLPNQKDCMKDAQRRLRQNKSDEYYLIKEGKYKHMEWEVGYSQSA